MHKERYSGACRWEKREIAKEIIGALKAQQLRFLKQRHDVQEGWYEATESEAIDKVCHALRRKEILKAEDPTDQLGASVDAAIIIPKYVNKSSSLENQEEH